MSMKAKYIEDAASVIDGRVAALKRELAGEYGKSQSDNARACDRAAILEAELCANLIRRLKVGRYGSEPYNFARSHRNRHGDVYDTKERPTDG